MGGISEVEAISITWILVAVSLTVVVLRGIVRGFLQSQLGVSDALVLTAWILLVCSCAMHVMSWRWGLWASGWDLMIGKSIPDITSVFPDDYDRRRIMFLIYSAPIPYLLCLYCIKGAFLLFYLQLFPKKLPKLRIALYVTIALVISGFVISLAMNLFWCLPIERNWSLDASTACMSSFSMVPDTCSLVFHILTDVILYTLPFFLIRYLPHDQPLSHRKHAGLIALLILGWVTILCAGFKGLHLSYAPVSNRLMFTCLWNTVQSALAIVVVCLPSLKWLWHARKEKTPSTSSLLGANGATGDNESGMQQRGISYGNGRCSLRWSRPHVVELVTVPLPHHDDDISILPSRPST